MADKRRTTITFHEFRKTKRIEDLVIEGTIHPQKDIISPEVQEKFTHFDIQNHSNWGVTYPKGDLVDAVVEGELLGYFHRHGKEKVYLLPIGMPGDDRGQGLVPCYECEVAIKLDWNK